MDKIVNVGGNSEEDTPVTIPNTEVKLFHVENTWMDVPGRQKAANFFCTFLGEIGRKGV